MTTVRDTFARTVAAGWGSTPSGLGWALTGGLASERAVVPGRARITLADTPGTLRACRIQRPWTDGEVLVQFSVDQVAAGGALLVGVMLRRDPADASAFYRVRAHLGTDSSVSLSVTRGVDQVGAAVATGLTYAPGSRLWMRARVDGHRVRARVWAHGTAEPGAWQADQTIATGTIGAGDMGVVFSGFATNTNPAPAVDFRRVDLIYQAAVENRLNGDVGQQVSNTTLSATAETGTVTVQAPGARAQYDTAQTALGLPTIRIASGHHRAETPRLRVALPASGPWSARWYCWVPALQDAGLGTAEVRSLAVLPAVAWVVHATAAGNIGTRLHVPDLAAAPIAWTTETGSAVSTGRWWRCELAWDGSVLSSWVFAGHSTTGGRLHTWTGQADPGRTLDITGFRWRRRPTLYWGDQGTEVRALQLELLDLGRSLGPAGADGDFGNATLSAVQSVQTQYGLTPVDGIPGPETRAAMDLALGRIPPPLWVSHLAVAAGPWIGPAEPVLTDEPEATGRLRIGLPI